MNSALFPLNCDSVGLGNIPLALILSSLMAERHLAKTASATIVNGTPQSNEALTVHFPVPF